MSVGSCTILFVPMHMEMASKAASWIACDQIIPTIALDAIKSANPQEKNFSYVLAAYKNAKEKLHTIYVNLPEEDKKALKIALENWLAGNPDLPQEILHQCHIDHQSLTEDYTQDVRNELMHNGDAFFTDYLAMLKTILYFKHDVHTKQNEWKQKKSSTHAPQLSPQEKDLKIAYKTRKFPIDLQILENKFFLDKIGRLFMPNEQQDLDPFDKRKRNADRLIAKIKVLYPTTILQPYAIAHLEKSIKELEKQKKDIKSVYKNKYAEAQEQVRLARKHDIENKHLSREEQHRQRQIELEKSRSARNRSCECLLA